MTKFEKGMQIVSILELVEIVEYGSWVYWNHKPLHPEWLKSMPLRTIMGAVSKGILWQAQEAADARQPMEAHREEDS